MTLSKAIYNIQRKNPNTVCVLKKEDSGMIWCGRAKYASSAFTCEAYSKPVKSIEYGLANYVITI